MKKALITGITGQDGSYLAEFLLNKGYEVHGMVRRSSTFNRQNIEHIFFNEEKRQAALHYGDMIDINSLIAIIRLVNPDEIYNLAAQSHVKVSFEIPFYTAQSDALGVLSLLEAVRILGLNTKIYQASTSELYSGNPEEAPQNEKTLFKPRSPYGVAKLYGLEIARVYRESYKMFVCNGILFNHESPRRADNFVSRKVTKGVAEIVCGTREKIYLGNLEASRDWGYAAEYVEAMWLMLQQPSPDDFVVATGRSHTVRELAEFAFKCADIEIEWRGSGSEEKGYDKKTGKVLVEIDSDYFRPNEVSYLRGDPAKIKKITGWEAKTSFEDLIKMMVKSDLDKCRDPLGHAKHFLKHI